MERKKKEQRSRCSTNDSNAETFKEAVDPLRTKDFIKPQKLTAREIATYIKERISGTKLEEEGWKVDVQKDKSVILRLSDAFSGISDEVLGHVFEEPYDYLVEDYPELTKYPKARRLNPIITKNVVAEMLCRRSLGKTPSVRELMKEIIHGMEGNLDYPKELDKYTEQQWTNLLDLAESYFLKTIFDLDEDSDASWIHSDIGWMEPDTVKVRKLRTYSGLEKGEQNEQWKIPTYYS